MSQTICLVPSGGQKIDSDGDQVGWRPRDSDTEGDRQLVQSNSHTTSTTRRPNSTRLEWSGVRLPAPLHSTIPLLQPALTRLLPASAPRILPSELLPTDLPRICSNASPLSPPRLFHTTAPATFSIAQLKRVSQAWARGGAGTCGVGERWKVHLTAEGPGVLSVRPHTPANAPPRTQRIRPARRRVPSLPSA